MSNDKNLPPIDGNETIKDSWGRLLVRDSNISNLFSGTDFTTDSSTQVEGTPNWRSDLKKLFIFIQGQGFVNLFSLIEAEELNFSADTFPNTIGNIQQALEYLNQRKQDSSIVLPGSSQIFACDGIRTNFPLKNSSESREVIFCYIDGVKQKSTDYSLGTGGSEIIFNIAPNFGETLEIIENSSWLQYKISPVVKNFIYESGEQVFDMSIDLLNKLNISINIEGKILQTSEYEVDGSLVTINIPMAVGTNIEIVTNIQSQIISPGSNTVTSESLQEKIINSENLSDSFTLKGSKIVDGSVSNAKLATNSISTIKIIDAAITNDKIAEGSISLEKLSELVASKLLGDKNVEGLNIANKAVGIEHISDELKALIEGTS